MKTPHDEPKFHEKNGIFPKMFSNEVFFSTSLNYSPMLRKIIICENLGENTDFFP